MLGDFQIFLFENAWKKSHLKIQKIFKDWKPIVFSKIEPYKFNFEHYTSKNISKKQIYNFPNSIGSAPKFILLFRK